MAEVRDFVDEVNLPKDYLVESYGKFYEEASGVERFITFEHFYDEWCSDIDEHCYKGVVKGI